MPPEIISKLGDKEIIDEQKKQVKRIDESRTEFRKQALINIMFLYGKHHLEMKSNYVNVSDLDQRLIWEIESIRKASNVRRVSNYILPLFRSLYSRLIRMKANVNVEPTTSTERDRNAAKVSQEVLEHFWENCNQGNEWMAQDFYSMQPILMRTVLYMLSLGNGYLFPYYNPKANTLIYDKKRNDVIATDVGEVEVRTVSPLNMFRNKFGRFFIERRFISPEQVYYEYDREAKGVRGEKDLVEQQIKRLLEGEIDESVESEGVYVYTKFVLPNKKYSKGRMIVSTDNELLFNDNIPEEYDSKIPLFNCKYQDLGFTSHSQGAIEQVIDLQQDYNETLTRISSYKNSLSGKVLNPRGSKLSAKFDQATGQILNYNKGFKPTYENGATIPSYIIQELMRIRRDMEDGMNSHDTSMGRPGGVKSGVAIDSLAENDFSMISPELITLEMTLSKFSTCVINMMKVKYIEPRLLGISGDNMAYEVNSFLGSDVYGQKRVKIRMGSGVPTSRKERQEYLTWLKAEGAISPTELREYSEFGDINGVYTSLDETGAKIDILNIIENEGKFEVLAEPYEDHTVRLKVLNDFRKGGKYARLSKEKRAAIDKLAQEHQNFLLAEQEASQSLGQPLPPAALPQPPQ